MQPQKKPDDTIKEMMVVEDPAAIKLLFSSRYGDILDLIDRRELSVSEIAKALKINPGSAQYHLKELEKHGLVKLVREEMKGNIVKKYYRATAKTFYIDNSKYKEMSADEASPMEVYLDKILASIKHFGYSIPPKKSRVIKQLLMDYDKRKKSLIKNVQETGFENIEKDRQLVQETYHIALLLKEIEDPELCKIRSSIFELLRS
jgi:DNA-binding transcriptional ArsR family regulator